MIIDVLMDRKDGYKYDNWMAREFIQYGLSFQFPELVAAFVKNDEKAIKQALCDYIDHDKTYNPDLKKYINAQNWKLPKDQEITVEQFSQMLNEHFIDQNELLEATERRLSNKRKTK